jgi:hydroxylaminobenzene mutase
VVGVTLLLASMMTGFATGAVPNPRMALSAHLAGTTSALMLLALSATWPRVSLSPRGHSWASGLLAFGAVTNWAIVLLAAIWGAGATTMPIAAKGMVGAPWQESVIATALLALSLAILVGLGLVLRGLLARGE